MVIQMVTRIKLKKLSKTRLNEVKVLFENELYDGVKYLSGYVIEFALKARICRILEQEEYLESGDFAHTYKTHKLTVLMKLAGLEKKLDEAQPSNPQLLVNWSLLSQWSEQSRYSFIETSPKNEAELIIQALEDKNSGVYTGIKKFW